MSTCAVELRTADVALTLANSVLGNLIDAAAQQEGADRDH